MERTIDEIVGNMQKLQIECLQKSKDVFLAFVNARELERQAFEDFHDGIQNIIVNLRSIQAEEQKKIDEWVDRQAEKYREVA